MSRTSLQSGNVRLPDDNNNTMHRNTSFLDLAVRWVVWSYHASGVGKIYMCVQAIPARLVQGVIKCGGVFRLAATNQYRVTCST